MPDPDRLDPNPTLTALYAHINARLLAINASSPTPKQNLDPQTGHFPPRVTNIAFLIRRACGVDTSPLNVDITATEMYDAQKAYSGQHIAVVVSAVGDNGRLQSRILVEKRVPLGENEVLGLGREVDRVVGEVLGEVLGEVSGRGWDGLGDGES